MSILSVGAKHVTKALVKEAVPEVLETATKTATKKAVKTKAVATNLGFLTEGRTKKQRLEIIDKHKSYGFDLEDSAYTEADLPQSIENVYNNAADGNWNGLSHAKQLETIDRIHGNGSIIPALVQEHGERTIRAPIDPRESIISGRAARRIQAKTQVANPPTTRADSIQPNLPQDEIDLYIEQSKEILRGGGRNRKDVGYLVDNNGEPFRLDQKGWEKVDGEDVKKYALISQRLKNARNDKLQEIRNQKVNLTTKEGIDTREFKRDPDPLAQHKAGVEEPHHRAGLHPVSRLKRGLSKRESKIFDAYLEKNGILAGNSRFNRDNLPKKVHKLLHSWLTKHKLMLGKDDLTELTLGQRKQYIDRFIRELKVADQKTYQLMKKYRRGDDLTIKGSKKARKKPKPTQFPEQIQRHITRSQEIGITEPSWKNGSIDYTWRPETNTGQIDIPPQSKKGFKGLRDEFFEQVEDLPSGSVWELNPKFKDEKRRRIYARLFEGDPRITRNADETLGWVLTIP